jgi:hypothetical protein
MGQLTRIGITTVVLKSVPQMFMCEMCGAQPVALEVVVEPLGSRAYWEEVRSLEDCP